MNASYFTQIWVAFKTFSSRSILKVGDGVKFFVSLVACVLLCYLLYAFYEVPVRDVQINAYKLYGLYEPDEIQLEMNMDFGTGITSKYRNDYSKGVFLNTANPTNWHNMDTTRLCGIGRIRYVQGNRVLRDYNYPLLDLIKLHQEELGANDIVRSLYAVHIVESKLPRTRYGLNTVLKGVKKAQAIYQGGAGRPDSIINFKNSYIYSISEGVDSISNLESSFSNIYIAKTDPAAANGFRLPTTMGLAQANILDPYDISQCYYHLTLDLSRESKKREFKLDFGGATEFSKMDPEPDKITMSSIVFNDSAKLEKIGNEGLWMHAKFKQLENIQLIRMFIITTALGFFVALLFSSGWKWLAIKCRRYIRKNNNKK